MKINLTNANKPKIYNIKSNIDPSLVGLSNSMGSIKSKSKNKAKTGTVNTGSTSGTAPAVIIETVKVPFPVLVDRFNIIGKSENSVFNNKTFFGMGKIQILLYPFDNTISFILASGDATKPDYLNMTGYGEIKLVFKNDSNLVDFPLYQESGSINLEIGQITFRVTQSKFQDIKKIYNSGVNIFYISSTNQGITSVVYTGLFKIYDNTTNVSELNNQAANTTPSIIKDPNLPKETATVTRMPVSKEPLPVAKPGKVSASITSTVKNNIKGLWD